MNIYIYSQYIWRDFVWLPSDKECIQISNQSVQHIFIYLFENQDYLWAHYMAAFFWFVLFNHRTGCTIPAVVGIIMTFYAFPKQSEHSAERRSFLHYRSHLQHVALLFWRVCLFFHTGGTWSNKMILQAFCSWHRGKHVLSSLHSRLIMWTPNKSLQFPFPEFFKDLVFAVH